MSDSLVIIPTYNEKENVQQMVRTVMGLKKDFHLLIIDDGSPDGTAQLVKDLMPEFDGRLHLEERSGKLGLGTAYIHGFKWALQRDYQFVFEMDCDFSHNPEDLIKLYDAANQEPADLVIGSRYIKGVNVVNWPMGRVLMSYYASAYVRFITGMNIRDTTAGFKCYRRIVLETIPLDEVKFFGYAFQIEMKFLAWKYGFKLFEVPIIFTDRTAGESKMSSGIFKEAIFGVLEMRWKSLFRNYQKERNEKVSH
ncbi:MAG: polyprenol monophosphomannose synthase [Flavobacteriales bacterium]|nr:polyprenol monophosphomannose synthase [Flavobacteriales bacterium]MCB9190192.1 polyprenol monophosphomannose synthase [Flavobacteriales bacterium]